MPDVIDEILKFDPGAKPKQPVSPDIIDQILKFDPGVGGTMQSKEPPFSGATSPISTITGKPETVYHPGADPSAGAWTIIKAGYVDSPMRKLKIFSEARGLPLNKYRISKGNVEFKNSEGQWQREVPELPAFQLYKGALQTITNPAVLLGTVGATLGPKGAIVGAMTGELARKGIGAGVFAEEQTPIENLAAVGLEGLLAAGGELVGLIGKKGGQSIKSYFVKKFKGRPAEAIKYGGKEISEGLLTPQEHAKALMIQNLADEYGIKLAPHQLYDKEGMTNTWMYLRKHHQTSDAVRTFEDKLAGSTDEAIDNFVRSLGGYEKTPYQLGIETKETAISAIERAKSVRKGQAKPLYDDVIKGSRELGITADVSGAIEEIDALLAETVKGDPSYAALNRVKSMIKNAKGDIGKLDRVKRSGIDTVLDKSKVPTLKREMAHVKDRLVSAMDEATGDAYKMARTRYEELSAPVTRLRKSIIGEISDIQKDVGVSKIPAKLFASRNMPDAVLLKKAKTVIQKENPELWDKLIGGYIRDVYEELTVAESGKILNVPGKLRKRLFGSKKQRELMAAALGDKTLEYKTFSDLMTVFERASIGMEKQSMTEPFQAIARQMGEIPGSKLYRLAMFPKQAITEIMLSTWNDILVAGKQKELMKALTSDEALRLIRTAKTMNPKTKKFIETLSVFTTLISNKIGIENIQGE